MEEFIPVKKSRPTSDDSEVDFSIELEKFYDSSEPCDLGDVSFLVEGKKVYANKALLSIWSPVMKAMFYNDFKEKSSSEVELPGKKHEDIVELMKVLYPPNKPIDENNVVILLPLAREYQMTHITKKCEQFLLSQPPSLASLVLADEYSLTGLQKVCMDYTKTCFLSKLEKESGFEDLLKDTKATMFLNMLDEQSAALERICTRVRSIPGGIPTPKCEHLEMFTYGQSPRETVRCGKCKDCLISLIANDIKPFKQ